VVVRAVILDKKKGTGRKTVNGAFLSAPESSGDSFRSDAKIIIDA
jgi:hypothetical protein